MKIQTNKMLTRAEMLEIADASVKKMITSTFTKLPSNHPHHYSKIAKHVTELKLQRYLGTREIYQYYYHLDLEDGLRYVFIVVIRNDPALFMELNGLVDVAVYATKGYLKDIDRLKYIGKVFQKREHELLDGCNFTELAAKIISELNTLETMVKAGIYKLGRVNMGAPTLALLARDAPLPYYIKNTEMDLDSYKESLPDKEGGILYAGMNIDVIQVREYCRKYFKLIKPTELVEILFDEIGNKELNVPDTGNKDILKHLFYLSINDNDYELSVREWTPLKITEFNLRKEGHEILVIKDSTAKAEVEFVREVVNKFKLDFETIFNNKIKYTASKK